MEYIFGDRARLDSFERPLVKFEIISVLEASTDNARQVEGHRVIGRCSIQGKHYRDFSSDEDGDRFFDEARLVHYMKKKLIEVREEIGVEAISYEVVDNERMQPQVHTEVHQGITPNRAKRIVKTFKMFEDRPVEASF